MKNYFVKFYQKGSVEKINPVPQENEVIEFSSGQVIDCSKEDMFFWIEQSKEQPIKLEIYEAKVICDLS